MYLLETHFHTAESSPCACVPAAAGVELYKKAGYDGIVVTDHFCANLQGDRGSRPWPAVVETFLSGWRAARRRGPEVGMDVFLGMELRFPGNEDDFLVYGFDEEFLFANPWLYEGELPAFSALARKAGLLVVQAHPFRLCCNRADPRFLDGVEVINGNPRHNSYNDLAQQWAVEHGKVRTAGSDFHEWEDCRGIGLRLPRGPASQAELPSLFRENAIPVGPVAEEEDVGFRFSV